MGSSEAVGVGALVLKNNNKKAQFLPFSEKQWIHTGHGPGSEK